MAADQIIIISQVPDEDAVVTDDKKMTGLWSFWLSQIQQFLGNFFPVYMVNSLIPDQGKIPQLVFAPPAMTTAQRNNLSSTGNLNNGVIIFNTDSGKISYYQGGIWQELP